MLGEKSNRVRANQEIKLGEDKEANKGVWGMPWLLEATKDVVSCDKLRGAANEL